jgi:hypothetical protein
MKLWLKRQLYKLIVRYRPHHSATVRLAFPLVALSALFFGAATIVSTTESYLLLEPSTSTIKEGEQFSVEVLIYAHEPVNAIDLAIAFPSEQVEVVGIDAGQSVITLWTKDPYFEDNTAYFQGGTYRRGFVGEHMIARIDARAKKSGVASIVAENIRLLAGDGTGAEVSVANEADTRTQIRIANKEGEVTGEIQIIRVLTDIDGDGEVSMNDVLSFMDAWRAKNAVYDFSGDGKMTFRDFAIILSDSFFK